MRFVIAPDSFKESLPAPAAAAAIARGIRRALPCAECLELPMADGGDGTAEALRAGLACRRVPCGVRGPLGEAAAAEYLILQGPDTAVLETAQACGLALIPPAGRDVTRATSFGVGELILHALCAGCKKLMLTLGGSGTNDGGMGLLQALGARFYSFDGAEVPLGAPALGGVARANLAPAAEKLSGAEITVLSDVTNPLLGPNGASYVYGPQKGARAGQLAALDAAMAVYAAAVEAGIGRSLREYPGAGAAGGLGFALLAAAPQAVFTGGAAAIAGLLGLEEKIAGCDFVFTGEGRFDGQSLSGKAPMEVVRLAKKHNKPAALLAGAVSDTQGEAVQGGQGGGTGTGDGGNTSAGSGKGPGGGVFGAVFCIQRGAVSLRQAMADTGQNLAATAAAVVSLWAGRGFGGGCPHGN